MAEWIVPLPADPLMVRPAVAELVARCEQLDALFDIVERIMTQHWDLAACPCWVCQSGREAGCRPRRVFLDDGYPHIPPPDWVEKL